MILTAFLCFSSCFCLLGYWLAGIPEVWAAAVEHEMDRGATLEQARIRMGWHRLGSLVLAFLNAVMAVTC